MDLARVWLACRPNRLGQHIGESVHDWINEGRLGPRQTKTMAAGYTDFVPPRTQSCLASSVNLDNASVRLMWSYASIEEEFGQPCYMIRNAFRISGCGYMPIFPVIRIGEKNGWVRRWVLSRCWCLINFCASEFGWTDRTADFWSPASLASYLHRT